MSTLVTDGARALRAFLGARGLSVPAFCEQHGLDRITVQRVLRGERKRISVDFAHAIEVATGGQVTWDLWRSVTADTPSHARRPSRKAKRRGGGGGGASGAAPARVARPSGAARGAKGRSPTTAELALSALRGAGELLEEMAPELADGDRCRVCRCGDAAPCPGGCAWVTPDLCSTCAEILEQLVTCVTRDGRKEDDLVRHLAHAFEEQLEDQAEAYVRKVLADLLERGVLRREGGRLWRSPPAATSRRARPARRAGADAAP